MGDTYHLTRHLMELEQRVSELEAVIVKLIGEDTEPESDDLQTAT